MCSRASAAAILLVHSAIKKNRSSLSRGYIYIQINYSKLGGNSVEKKAEEAKRLDERGKKCVIEGRGSDVVICQIIFYSGLKRGSIESKGSPSLVV